MHSYEMPFKWICVAVHAQCKTKLEVFIEHIPHAERLQDIAITDVASLPMRIEQVLSRILYLCMAISKVWE